MTIGELQSASGLAASTIRYWESIGVLPKPARVSGRRRYGPEALQQLAVLRLAQACGFRLDEMRHLLHGFPPGVPLSSRWRALARKKAAELDQHLEKLKAMRQLVDRIGRCNCSGLAGCAELYFYLHRDSCR